MSELKITKDAALKALNSADENGKKMLTILFGEKNLYTDITERVNSYQDACEVQGVNPVKITIEEGGLDESDKDAVLAFAEMILITKVLNEDKKIDWVDSTQWKYRVWLDKFIPGVGFSHSRYGNTCTGTTVGSRLSLLSSKTAIHFGKKFLSHLNRMFT